MNVLCLNTEWKHRQRKRVLFVFGKCGLIKGREREAAARYWFLPNYENGHLHKNLEGGNSSFCAINAAAMDVEQQKYNL